jgi:hypothetical protein
VLLILGWVIRRVFLKQCRETETEPESKLEGAAVSTGSLVSSLSPSHIRPPLLSSVKTVQQHSGGKGEAESLMEDKLQLPLSMTEMVTMQGGQVSNNALWDEQQQGQSSSPAAVARHLSVSSCLTARKQQTEPDDSEGTQKGLLFNDSTAMQTLPVMSSTSSQPCACLKGRPSRVLNWSLAVRVCDKTDVSSLPLASLPQQQPPSRSVF